MTGVQIRHSTDLRRYEAHVDRALAGFAEYQLSDDVITFTHTEVRPEFEGQGIGSALARFALDDVRADGELQVVARCPFIKRWIRLHPDYRPLLAPASERDSP
jgi:uncharacterized protein